MKNFYYKKIKNSLTTNQSYIHVFVNNYISCNNVNSDVKQYLYSCLKQAIEFSEVQKNMSIETRSLTQFYSLVSLTKVYLIINSDEKDITINKLIKKFSSHGASSKDKEIININKNGVFVELSNILNLNLNDSYSLISLYKKIPDLLEVLSFVSKEPSDFIKIEYAQDYMFRTGNMMSEIFYHWIVCEGNYKEKIIEKYSDLKIQKSNKKLLILSKENINEYLDDLLNFDVSGNIFLDIDNSNMNEILAIYLIFLKYSSLSRYKPNFWYEKIESNETIIIERMLNDIFEKYWAIITTDLELRSFD